MTSSILILIGSFVLWAALHSLLASLPVKRWAWHLFGPSADRWYRLAFNAVAALTLSPLLPLLARLPDRTLYAVPSPWRWAMVSGQALALVALFWTLLQTGALHFAGLAQLLATEPASSGPLQVRGFYCHVRHPLYFFSLLLIWLQPTVTANSLTVTILTTLYFYLGSLHEEKRLLAEFGAAYRDYQQRVPRLVPRLRRCYPPTNVGQDKTLPV